MSNRLTRRDFLKLGAATSLGLAFRDFPSGGDPALRRGPSFHMGRNVFSQRYYERPTTFSTELGYYLTDGVVNVYEETIGDPRPWGNPLWLRTDDGWLQGAYVQPVGNSLNAPVLSFPSTGMLVETTVPYSQAYEVLKDGRWKPKYRFYYKTTHWVQYAFTITNGAVWYEIVDDRYGGTYMAQAEHFRPVTAEDVTPISPGVPEKRIEVDLTRQRLVAYEGSLPVFATRIATGSFPGSTPIGEYRVERKQPSRHMANDFDGDDFDLPGVPWVCFISWTGVSLHGTYWHNNYGQPQSHGCINLKPEAALWVYRWTDPFVPVEKDRLESDQGTRVVVF
jgi:lipoprotein-anchoring transpeptidase ErfK/SrfK